MITKIDNHPSEVGLEWRSNNLPKKSRPFHHGHSSIEFYNYPFSFSPGVNAETKIANKQEVGKKDCEQKTVNEENEEKAVTRDIEEKRTGVTKDQEAGSISKVTDCNAQKDR